jgi:hypothetical protein
MNVSLRPEVERFVEEKVRAGHYRSADDAVNGLLTKLREQEQGGGNGATGKAQPFPVFDVPPGTRPFTSEDVRRADDEP